MAANAPAQPRTKLTLEVAGCDDCRILLVQAREGRAKSWEAPIRQVVDGEVSWKVPTKRTEGMTMFVLADWDGSNYVPGVTMRYAGLKPGKTVTNAVAKTKSRAATCWAGTDADAVTIPITVVRAKTTNIEGERVDTPRAFASVTQEWLKPMQSAWRGITGAHDVTYCR